VVYEPREADRIFYGHLLDPCPKTIEYDTQKREKYLTVLVTQKYELFLFRTYEEQWQQCVSLSVGSTLTVQTRQAFFSAFIVYSNMSAVSNANITFGCVQFVSSKIRIYTLLIFMAGLVILFWLWYTRYILIRV
jgi:hypothetical protein